MTIQRKLAKASRRKPSVARLTAVQRIHSYNEIYCRLEGPITLAQEHRYARTSGDGEIQCNGHCFAPFWWGHELLPSFGEARREDVNPECP